MAINAIKMIIPCQCLLGEGPYFSRTHNSLFWVDILSKVLYQFDFKQQTVKAFQMPEPICWLMETHDQQLIAGFENAIYYLDCNTLQRASLYCQLDEPKGNRLNDAKTDRNGNLFFGTMDKLEQQNTGSLYRLGNGNSLQKVDTNYVISNGPAISKNGRTLYSTESLTQTIYQFDLNDQGELSNKRIFVKFDETMGFPDGMTVDNEDHLWVAAWDGFGVYRFTPFGEKIQFIKLPVPRITSVAFVGESLEYLAVTSARVGLDEDALKKYEKSGSVFILNPNVNGVSEALAVI